MVNTIRRKIFSVLLCAVVALASFNINVIEADATGTFNITVNPSTVGYGSVSINWGDYDFTNKNFKVYKSLDGGKTYETVGIDYTSIDKIKVLQIAPNASANQLKTWMETNGYGKGIIKIDSILMSEFNVSPNSYLKDSNGNWKYDVLVVGFWDMNGSATFSDSALSYIIEWIKAGKGFILGHDTIANYSDYYNGSPTTIFNYRLNFIKLQSYFNIHTIVNGKTDTGVTATGTGIVNKAYIHKKGLITNYPWKIGDVGTVLDIPDCHTSGQIAYGDVWLTLGSSATFASDGIGISNPYVTTFNNCAQIQTGHSNGTATADEQKILANLIFYMNQLLFNTYTTNDNSAQDVTAPNAPTIKLNGGTVCFSSLDNGSTYKYYVESYDKNDTTSTGLIDRSATKEVTVATGIKSYRYIYDNNSSTIVTNTNSTQTTNSSIAYSDSKRYLHVASVDKAGNISATTTIDLWSNRAITTSYKGVGSISNSSDVKYGTDTSVFIMPAEGFELTGLKVDGISVNPVSTYNFMCVKNNHTIEATFTMTQTKKMELLSKGYDWIELKLN